jgi:hypothetical protein
MADRGGIGIKKWKSAPGIIQPNLKPVTETTTPKPLATDAPHMPLTLKKTTITTPPPAPLNAPTRNIWEASKPPSPNLAMPQQVANELREEYEQRIAATEQAAYEDPLRIDYRNRKPRVSRMSPEKKRTRCFSVSVSYEEEAILRSYVESTHQSLTAWARDTLFKAIGRRLPPRTRDMDDEE